MKRPNIILITTDQQRFDTLPPYAPSFMRTPHLNHLARDGVVFDRAYADCPISVASRTTIMTGKYARNHGMPNNGETTKVMGRHETLPSLLREAGYQTAAIGKMHFGPERARHGFDEMILPADYYDMMRKSGRPQQPMRHGLGQNELYPTLATVPECDTLTSWTAEQCVDYIKDRRDPTVPFFLWCSFSKPHPPLDPPEPYYSMYRNCQIPEPVTGPWRTDDRCPIAFRRLAEEWSLDLIPPEIIREARSAYYGLITQIDYNIGRIFGALQDFGKEMFDETMILFASDHGEYLGDHGTGCKVFFHESSARIPFILREPKSWKNRRFGDRVGNPTSLSDILPTFVAAAGGRIPDDIDGANLSAVLRKEIEPRKYLTAMANHQHPQPKSALYFGITDGRWKYICYPEGPSEQLFDLETDPREVRDLSQDAGAEAVKKELRKALLDQEKKCGGEYLEGENLVSFSPGTDTTAERRSKPWPGYHTERYHVDVRH